LTTFTSPLPYETRAEDDTKVDEAQHYQPAPHVIAPRSACSVSVTVGSRLTTVVAKRGGDAPIVKIVRHGAVRLAASQAAAASARAGAAARVIRATADQVVERARIAELGGFDVSSLRASGLAQAVIGLGAPGRSRATVNEVRAATEALAGLWTASAPDERASSAVESMMIASAVLSSILESLGSDAVTVRTESAAAGLPAVD